MAKLTHPKGRQVDVPDAKVEYYTSRGWTPADEEPAPVEIPDGDPTEDWTGKQLDAFAAREGIDLAGASNKAAKVAAIEAARTNA